MLLYSFIHFSYFVENFAAIETNTFKLMGITYSNLCEFNEHIVNITNHAKFVSHLLFCTFCKDSEEFYKTLYVIYVRSIIEVNTSVWSPSHIRSINLVEDVQATVYT